MRRVSLRKAPAAVVALVASVVPTAALAEPNTPLAASATDATAAAINPTSLESVRDAYLTQLRPALATPFGWNGSVAGCIPGTLDTATQEATLTALNFTRGLAGLNTVQFSASLNETAQAAALMMDANRSLSHNPPPTWRCWTQAASIGAGSSNLLLGNNSGPLAIDLYMDDPGSTNYFVGHRRWILHPETLVMGTGSTPFAGALNVLGGQRAPDTSSPGWVPWPSGGFFPNQLEPNGRWSLSANAPETTDFSDATVTVTDSFGQPVPVQTIHQPVAGYGMDTLVWEMGWDTQASGLVNRTFNVHVSGMVRGGVGMSHTYSVEMFNPELPNAGLPPDPVCRSDRGVYSLWNRSGLSATTFNNGANAISFTTGILGMTGPDQPWGDLVCRTNSGGTWSGPVSLGGGITGAPASTTSPDGTITVLARGTDGALWGRRRNPAGTWTPWTSYGGIITTSPAAAATVNGVVHVIARGQDNALWIRTLTTGWQPLGGIIGASNGFGRFDPSADPTVIARPDGSLLIAARGQDNGLWQRSLTSGWSPLGGLAYSGPTAVARGASVLLFVRGIDDALWTRTLSSGWQALGGIVYPHLAGYTDAAGATVVIGRGQDGNGWARTLPPDSGSWSPWTNIGFPG